MMGTVNYMSPGTDRGPWRGPAHGHLCRRCRALRGDGARTGVPGRARRGVLHRILNEGAVPLAERVPEHRSGARRHRARARSNEIRHCGIRRPASCAATSHACAGRLPEDARRGPRSRSGTAPWSSVEPPAGHRRLRAIGPGGSTPPGSPSCSGSRWKSTCGCGEDAFARDDHEAAIQHAERAATVDPESRAAFDLIDRVRFAIEAKGIREKLAQAQRLLAAGNMDEAASLANEASVTLPRRT